MDIAVRLPKEVLFTVVVPRVARRWDDVGLALGLDSETMRSIKKMNHLQDTMKCKEMLNKWLETSGHEVNWEQLIEAVKFTKFEDVAEDIQVLLKVKKTGASGNIGYCTVLLLSYILTLKPALARNWPQVHISNKKHCNI